jgi:hypothetical protein
MRIFTIDFKIYADLPNTVSWLLVLFNEDLKELTNLLGKESSSMHYNSIVKFL